jgi:hypothetical protein
VLPDNKRTIDALIMAELESLNDSEYLIVVNMTIIDCHSEPGVSPYSHLGYFTAELPCLKKSNLSNTEGTLSTVKILRGSPRDLILRKNNTLPVRDFIEEK